MVLFLLTSQEAAICHFFTQRIVATVIIDNIEFAAQLYQQMPV
jgi:hypothetical protein